jgi:hypothetical protein
METDAKTALPIDIAPVSDEVRKKNEFHAGEIFPFRTWQSLPSFSTVVLNVSLSAGILLVGAGGLLLTLGVFLPIGILKTMGGWIRRREPARPEKDRRRCVVITGAR